MFLVNEKPERSGDFSMKISHIVRVLFFVTTCIVLFIRLLLASVIEQKHFTPAGGRGKGDTPPA